MTVVNDGDAMERMNMSARAYDRILKVARTIADLEGTHDVLTHHITREWSLMVEVEL